MLILFKILIILGVPFGIWLWGYIREYNFQQRLFQKIQLRDHESVMEIIGAYPFRDLRDKTFKEAITIANELRMGEISAVLGAEFLRTFKKGAYVKSPNQDFPTKFFRRDEVLWINFSPAFLLVAIALYSLFQGFYELFLTELIIAMGFYLVLSKFYGFDFTTEYESSQNKIICKSRLPWLNHIIDLNQVQDFHYNRGNYISTVTLYRSDGMAMGVLPLKAFDFTTVDIWIISHLQMKK